MILVCDTTGQFLNWHCIGLYNSVTEGDSFHLNKHTFRNSSGIP